MRNLSQQIIKNKRNVVLIFVGAALICALMLTQLKVNYNIVDYLPQNAQSTIALEIMEREFAENVPNARVMITGVSLPEALEYKERIAAIDGVSAVMWLDDLIDLKEPLAMADQNTVESYYKERAALFSVTIAESFEIPATDAIYALIGKDNALAGQAVSTATMQKLSVSESLRAMAILVPVIIIILLLSTTSWIEPLLFLVTIGIAVLLNMGTNIFLGEISFITQAISPILQMAVSLDYAIFLLHSFDECRKQTGRAGEAMRLAMGRSFSTIAASAATTLSGFVALIFMKFGLGSDLGINLVKGIAFSFAAVMLFLPALTLSCYKVIDRTRHQKIIPNFNNCLRASRFTDPFGPGR